MEDRPGSFPQLLGPSLKFTVDAPASAIGSQEVPITITGVNAYGSTVTQQGTVSLQVQPPSSTTLDAYGLWMIIILVALVLFATSTTKKKA